MSRPAVPVYLFGEAESFVSIPFDVFNALSRGDMLSFSGEEGKGIRAFMVRYKEAYISETNEAMYSLQVEEW